MKKAKIVLSAVALFAVVGGALAFKATREESTFFYNTTTAVNGPLRCVGVTDLFYTTINNGLPAQTLTSINTISYTNRACPTITVYPAQ